MGGGKPQSVTCGLDACIGAKLVDLIWFGIEYPSVWGCSGTQKTCRESNGLCLSLRIQGVKPGEVAKPGEAGARNNLVIVCAT
jgi:hypothetical protein